MKPFQRICLLPIFLLLFGLTPAAFGWNRATHMVIGAIAYRDLQNTSPQTAARVVAILRQHPDYQQRWAAKLNDSTLTDDQKNQYLFMLAARWPDDVKTKDNPYDHPTWHYINYVYKPEQGVASTDSVLATGENILQAFEENRQILRSNAPDSTKAIALCWIFHLTGDIHMPLHTVSLISSQFPEGDQGGNRFKIRVTPEGKTINLHGFWDGMLLGADDAQSVNNLAVQLRQSIPRSHLPQLDKPNMADWSAESFQLAREQAYRNGQLTAGVGDEGVPLPADYIQTVKPIAERQVTLSGYRLADVLMADVK